MLKHKPLNGEPEPRWEPKRLQSPLGYKILMNYENDLSKVPAVYLCRGIVYILKLGV